MEISSRWGIGGKPIPQEFYDPAGVSEKQSGLLKRKKLTTKVSFFY
jgi:hypothetical protein